MERTAPGLARPPVWRRLLPVVGLALLVWVLSRLDLPAMAAGLSRLSGSAILLAALPFSLNLLLKAVRWWRLLHAQGRPLPFAVALAAYLTGQFYGQVTVWRLGEFYRAEALVERGVGAGEALSSCVVDRLFDLALVFLLGSVMGAFIVGQQRAAWVALIASLVLGSGALAVWLAFRRAGVPLRLDTVTRRLGDRLERYPWLRRPARFMREMLAGTLSLLRPGPIVEASGWTIAAWLGYFATLWMLAAGMQLSVPNAILTGAAALAALSALLPVTVSGLGARELIYQEILAPLGVPAELAVLTALLHLAIMTGVAIVLGAVGLALRRVQRGTW